MAFDVAGAKAAGYSDQEIQQYLSGQSRVTSPEPAPDGLQALRKVMAIKGLLDVKNASKYSSAMELIEKMTPEGSYTAEQKNRADAIKPALSILSDIKQSNLPDVGYLGALYVPALLKRFGGRGVSRNVANLDSKYGNLRQIVLRVYQGGRMSDKDYEQANKYVPDIIDTPTRAKDKIQNLENLLNKVSKPGYAPQTSGQTIKRKSLEDLIK
jgi:hypothetical protein